MTDFSNHQPLDGSAAVATEAGQVGTAGCFVRVGSNARCILGSAHVMGVVECEIIFHPPATIDGSLQVAKLWDAYGPANSGQATNVLDAAIAVLPAGLRIDPRIGSLGRPRGFNTNLVEHQRVRIHGAGSGEATSGQILNLDDTTTVTYEDKTVARFAGLVRCQRYSVAGDSGAAVLDANGFVVGVHLCGSPDFSWFCPISMVIARWPNIELITHT